MPLPFINGVQYTWGEVAIRALGNVFVGVENIKYDDDQDMEMNHGAGNYAIGMGAGKIKAKGSIMLYQEELEALVNAAPGRRLQSIPNFDITVSFIPEIGQAQVNHTIKNVRLMNNRRDMSSGDMKVTSEINFIASHVAW